MLTQNLLRIAQRAASTTDDGRPRVNAVLIVPHGPAAAQVRALGWDEADCEAGPIKGVRHVTTLDEISALTRPNHPDDWTELDSAAVDTVRVLAADAVQKVGNGHPGTAMSLAPLAYTLFQRQMRHDPSDVHWVGRAMAARYERGLFDPDAAPGTSPFDHFIYVIASDGDMEEGVTSEASSLAGTQQLGNLIVFYDHNQISIEHDTN